MIRMNNIKKKDLTPFIAPGSTIPLTQEEINKRKIRIERAEELGIYLTAVGPENIEYENPYKMQALYLIIQDKEVPEKIKKQIKDFEVMQKIKENSYKKK